MPSLVYMHFALPEVHGVLHKEASLLQHVALDVSHEDRVGQEYGKTSHFNSLPAATSTHKGHIDPREKMVQ